MCGKGLSVNSKLIQHQRIHTGVRPFKYVVCEKTFGFNSEDQKVHIRDLTVSQCKECRKAFNVSAKLIRH